MSDVAIALIRRGDRWFLQRRDLANPVLPGVWEFPGGKCEGGESPERALRRELRDEVSVALLKAQPWPVLEGILRLHPFLSEVDGEPRTELAWGWFTADEMLKLPVPPLNHALIERIQGCRNFESLHLI